MKQKSGIYIVFELDQFSSAVNDAVEGCFGTIVKSAVAFWGVLAFIVFVFKSTHNLADNP